MTLQHRYFIMPENYSLHSLCNWHEFSISVWYEMKKTLSSGPFELGEIWDTLLSPVLMPSMTDDLNSPWEYIISQNGWKGPVIASRSQATGFCSQQKWFLKPHGLTMPQKTLQLPKIVHTFTTRSFLTECLHPLFLFQVHTMYQHKKTDQSCVSVQVALAIGNMSRSVCLSVY